RVPRLCGLVARSARSLSSGARRDGESAPHRGSRHKGLERTGDVWKAGKSHQLGGLVEADQVAHPGEYGDVGDGVTLAHEPAALRQLGIEHGQQPARLLHVSVARPLVRKVLARKLMEEADLSEHGPNTAHL